MFHAAVQLAGWEAKMKTRAQFLLVGLLSIVPLFSQESEAGLFAARLIGVEQEALQQIQLSDSHEGQKNQEASALGRLALALSAGNDAMGPLRGSQTEYREKDRLKPPIPDMECDVDRIVSYVSCYSSVIGTREEAGNLFTRFVDELQSTLPSDRWREVKEEPRINSIRSYTYADQESDAHIDIDLIALADSYMVRIVGWTATDPQL
jgi:hypothetical protein